MKHFLGAAAMVAGLLAVAAPASATPAGEVGKLAPMTETTGTLQVDFRPYRHCHGPRWDRYCHGGIFFRDRDRHRRHWRHHRRDDYRGHYRRGYRDRDRY
jgi:hypothetical protein